MLPVRASVRHRGLPLVTLALIAACAAAFWHELSLPGPALEGLLRTWGVVPAAWRDALRTDPGALEGWALPLLTSAFLHAGWGHLLGNMLFLWVFGGGVEARLGWTRFALFYGACAVGAAAAQIAADPAGTAPTIGASGAIAGVMGAYLVFFPFSRVSLLSPFLLRRTEVPALLFLGLWFLQQVLLGTLAALTPQGEASGGVAWWAHVGGFAVGVLLLPVLLERGRARLA